MNTKHLSIVRVTLILFSIIMLVPGQVCSGQKGNNQFSGKWHWLKNNLHQDFSLELEQHGTKLLGRSDAVGLEGNKIDDGNIEGTINGQTATVTFYSSFSADNGKALLMLKGKYLFWKVLKPPGDEYWQPNYAELVRQHL